MWDQIRASEAIHTGVKSAVSFSGTGTNDLTLAGNSEFAPSRSYQVKIDGTETYKWSNDGGASWEATEQPILLNLPISLVNAEGESEGVTIAFGSQSGHVLNDTWSFTTTGQVVPTSATLLAKKPCLNAEVIVLKGEYSKGTEDGLQIYIELPKTLNGTVGYPPSRPTAVAGVLTHYPEKFELTSSASFSYTFETNGNRYVNVYAVRKGSTACSGLFTLFAEQNRVRS